MKKFLFYLFIALLTWKISSVMQVPSALPENFSVDVINKNAPSAARRNTVSQNQNPASVCAGYLKNKKFDTASVCYKNALLHDKWNPELSCNLAYALYMMKDYKGAAYYADYTVKNFPNSAYTQYASNLYKDALSHFAPKQEAKEDDTGDYYDEISAKRWAKMPVKFWLQPEVDNANLSGSFFVWQHALYPVISFKQVYKEKEADLKVYFGDLPEDAGDDCAGMTHTYFYHNKPDIIAEVKISLTESGKRGRYTNEELFGILVHEIGHAIGVKNHSSNPNDIMYYRMSDSIRPTKRDINTVKKIYSTIKAK